MNYETHYRKGFHGKPALWQRFYDAVKAADCNEIHDCIDARCRELGLEGKGPAVDPDIFATKSPDLHLLRSNRVQTPEVQTEEFDAEWKFIHEVSQSRDERLEDLPAEYPRSLKELPYFLRNTLVRSSQDGVDFMETEDHLIHILEGRAPTEVAVRTQPKPIETLRDAAWFVHDDNPLEIYSRIAGELLADGCEHQVPAGMMRGSRTKRFASVGMPYLMGALGMVMNRVGLISFREKWTHWTPRPEQYGYDRGLGILSQVFPEGSPQHPSRNAMHQIIYSAMTGFMLEIFDNLHVLPNGKTVEHELTLLEEAGGDYRIAAGVHYHSDNTPYRFRGRLLGQKIAKELGF